MKTPTENAAAAPSSPTKAERIAEQAALLASVPIFEDLADEDRVALALEMEEVHLHAGALLCSYGDPGDSMFILREGEVDIFIKNDTGEKVVLERCGPGAFFGEISLLDRGPRSAAIEALTPIEILKLDREHLDHFITSHPAAAAVMLSVMGKRLRSSSEKLRHTATRNVNEETEDKRTVVERSADWIAEFSGSIPFLMIHVFLFSFWILGNNFMGKRAFDPYPYGLLTMSVSLEAIFLSVFVLLSQNRQAEKDRVRADIEYDVNLKAELEVAHLHEKMDQFRADVLARLARIEHTGKTARASRPETREGF